MQDKQQRPSHFSLPQRPKLTTYLHQVETVKTFSNPICKETYDSLPRIYGRKKKKIRVVTSAEKQISKLEEHIQLKNINQYSSNDVKSTSHEKQVKNAERATRLSETKHPINCNRKNCYCQNYSEEKGQCKIQSRLSLSKMRKIILPEIRKFQLKDLQSHNRASPQGIYVHIAPYPSSFQNIMSQNGTKQGNGYNNKVQLTENKNNIHELKSKYKLKHKFNHDRFQIEEESDQEKKTDENYGQDQKKRVKKSRKLSARYKTEGVQSETPKSGNSIALSSLLFRSSKRSNTKFHDLNISEKSFEKNRLSRAPSQLTNGLFRIPEEPQYQQYLKNYKNLNPDFNIKSIIKSSKFKIIKGEKQVYFGEVDEMQRKSGKGINISEKEIYEGEYQKGFKFYGIQRNIDGMYIGGFKNGLRSGQGVFKWNNRQIFEGNWKNGMKNGFGIWKSPKGDSYQGSWFQNRQHGEGIFKHRTSTYKGQFKNFLKDGKGCQVFSNGDKYQGQYKDGKPHGRGKYEWSEGGYYQGQFVKGMRQGKGKWIDTNGTIYEGQFKQDFKHGFGKQTYPSGEKYQGQFFEGTKTKGRLEDKNANCIQIIGK